MWQLFNEGRRKLKRRKENTRIRKSSTIISSENAKHGVRNEYVMKEENVHGDNEHRHTHTVKMFVYLI